MLVRIVGGASVIATVGDVLSDGAFTLGEGAKVAISGISAANPIAGLAIGGIDLATEAITGKSATQWVADGLDKMTGGWAIDLPW